MFGGHREDPHPSVWKSGLSRNGSVASKPGTVVCGLGRLTLKETHPSTQMGRCPSGSGRVSVDLKAEIGLK
jgi:hypothetical protein